MNAEVTESMRGDPVRQFSIYADNKVGRLNELVQRLAMRDIHIMAFSQLDTTECTVMRVIVDYPEEARRMLNEARYAFCEVEMVVVEINSEADLKFVTAALVEAEINIHYLYSFIMRPNGKVALAINLEDPELATEVLHCRGLKTLRQNDIAR
ncbi:MAG: acetolactate synthase [Verrucomicrobia bacterium]|nr:acetolactate synthase [Verrucomicrobiota bacterium]